MFKNLIFVHERVGKDGKPFKMYKIRTMYPGADEDKRKYSRLNEADGPVFKIRNDPRYTNIGKWLAMTGLDELPQIVNVIRGEMNMVGPRPLPPLEERKIPDKWRLPRRSVKPGITSSWVVRGSHKLSFAEWMELDMMDIQQKSFLHDGMIMARTLSLIFTNVFHLVVSAIIRFSLD